MESLQFPFCQAVEGFNIFDSKKLVKDYSQMRDRQRYPAREKYTMARLAKDRDRVPGSRVSCLALSFVRIKNHLFR